MQIVFMGTPEFSLNVLQTLIDSNYEVVGVVTQPDRKVGRKQLLKAPPVKQLASNNNIKVFQPESIKTDYKEIVSLKPDIIITCAYGQIIPKELLDFPKYGAINVHASLLPKYRGGAPIHKAIIDGCRKTGITIMYMSEKMDAGDIISQEEVTIEAQDTVGTLHDKLSLVGAKLLSETLPSIFSDTNKRTKQNEEEVSYANNIKAIDERIDWSMTGEDIINQIRGLNPFPGAYTTLDGKRIKIFGVEELVRIHNHKPGEILGVFSDYILITTGNCECVKINGVQFEGKKRQNLKEVLNGNHPFETGKILK